MEAKSRAFLDQLLTTPSPSGYEEPVQEVVRQYVAPFADQVETDVLGNVIACRNPDAPLRVMLTGHCDQIGLNVNYIDSEGYIYVLSLGGWDVSNLLGQHVTIWTKNGPVPGVIGRKPIHLLEEEERKRAVKLNDIWIDIGEKTKEAAEQIVEIGDPITVKMTVTELRNNNIATSAADDRVGVWVAMEALRRLDAAKLKCAAFAVSTVQEELGLRGATGAVYSVHPHVAIALDVTFASDCPTIEKKRLGDICLGKGGAIGRGPNMNPVVVARLVQASKENNIPYQISASGSPPGTDARAMQLSRGGTASGLVSIPNRYMHSPVEVFSLDDIDSIADMLARFIEGLDESVSFIPSV